MSWVVDASAAVEYLLRTTLGRKLAPTLELTDLFAPALLDVEVLAVLRRAERAEQLSESRAREAIDDLRLWDLERLPHRDFLPTAFQLRHNVSAYDAMYLAAAHTLDVPLVTTDARLARAPTLPISVHVVR